MPLERVLMFDNSNGWMPVTADKAAEIHPGGTVPASSGLFMCDKCHKYVYFADGEKKRRYFGHSRGDDKSDKECEDRAKQIANRYDPRQKLKGVLKIEFKKNKFDFSIGLILPNPTSAKGTIEIIPSSGNSFIYNLSRFGENTFSFFYVGNYPAKSYRIETKCQHILSFPQQVEGINDRITIFDKNTGKKLPEWTNVQVKKSYLMLCKGQYLEWCTNITHYFVCQYGGFTLYEFYANEFSRSASDFFYNLKFVLTSFQSKLFPLWPIYKNSPYIVFHNSKQMFVYAQGENINPRIFPMRNFTGFELDMHSTLLEIQCSGREQVLVLNQFNPDIKQITLWESDLTNTASLPNVEIKDLRGNVIIDDAVIELPYKNTLLVSADFDGFVLFYHADRLVEKRHLKSETSSEFNSVYFGDKLEIYQGLDKIRTVEFISNKMPGDLNEASFVRMLEQCKGDFIAAPRCLGVRLDRRKYPLIYKWLYKTIRSGIVSEKALKLYKKFLIDRRF